MKYLRRQQLVDACQFWPWDRHGVRCVELSGDAHSLEGQIVRWEFDLPLGPAALVPGDWIVTNQEGVQQIIAEAEFERHFVGPLDETAHAELDQRPQRFRYRGVSDAVWRYGCYFPHCETVLLATGERLADADNLPGLEWLD